jgi:hypothetical protein
MRWLWYILVIASILICLKDYVNFFPVFCLGMIGVYLIGK